MKNQLLRDLIVLHQKNKQNTKRKNIGLLLVCYVAVSLLFRFFIRDALFRAGIYEEWFIDLTTIGPFFQAIIATLLLSVFMIYYYKEKTSSEQVLQSLLSFVVTLVLFRWFTLLILGGGILVLVDLQDHGVVQHYVEQHFWIDGFAILMDFFVFRYLYQKSA